MEELNVMMVPDDSSRVYILWCDLGKYYEYYLSIYAYFIKYNTSFQCTSEYPHDLRKGRENILSDYQRHLLQDEGFC